jgi:hypothetical protein
VCQLFIDSKKAYDSIRREVLYDILIHFGVTMKLASVIKMCLNKTYSRVRLDKHLSNKFPIRNVLRLGDALLPSLFTFGLEYAIRRIREIQEGLKLNAKRQLLDLLLMLIYWVEACVL